MLQSAVRSVVSSAVLSMLGESGGLVPALDFAFAGATALDPRITFTRSTTATLYDSAGKLTYAPNNQLVRSQDFTMNWGIDAITLTNNAVAAPDGSITAARVVPNNGLLPTTAGAAGLTQFANPNDLTSIYSFYAKSGEITSIAVRDNYGGGILYFNMGTNSTSGGSGGVSNLSIQLVSDGWYRCSFKFSGKTGTNNFSLRGGVTGDGVSGFYVWGFQMEAVTYQTTARAYNATNDSIYNGPRFDYDPVTLEAKGLLIEEQRTNLMLKSEDFGTTWGTTNYVLTTNATASPDGATTADKLARDTVNATVQIIQAVTCVANTAHNFSCFVKAAEWSKIGLRDGVSGSYVTFDLTNTTVISTSLATGTITPYNNGWYRVAMQTTTGAAQTTYGVRIIPLPDTYTSGNPVYSFAGDNTSGLYLWGAQLEVGAFATSYIPTTTSALTRAADVASMTGANFSGWYNQAEGTMFAEFGPYANGGASKNFGIAHIDDGTSNNMIRLFAGSTVSPVFAVTASTVTQAYLSSEVIAPTSVSRIAGAYKTDSFARSVNGTVAATDLLGTVPVVNRLLIGSGLVGVNELNGHLRSFKYYSTRLSDATLQSLTKFPPVPRLSHTLLQIGLTTQISA